MTERGRGPVEAHRWPSQLPARVASPGAEPRIHGYAVLADLARHYSFAEQTYLALTGSLPDAEQARAFEWTLSVLGATSVAEAPVHCAVVVRLCGASTGAAYAAGYTGLTEQATDLLARHADFLAWLDGERADFPDAHANDGPTDRALRDEARAILKGLSLPCLERPLSAEATLLAVLHRCGVRAPAAMLATITLARLPVLAAETMAQRPLAFREYPMDLPDFVIEGDDR